MIMMMLFAGSQAETILIYVFIGIFIITAALTLASLPNWIKLDEWYRKKLFTALILEVIGIIIIAGRVIFMQGETTSYEYPKDMSWVALNEYGMVVYPEVKVNDLKTDSVYTLRLSKNHLDRVPELKLTMSLEDSSRLSLIVRSENDVVLGKIGNAALYEAGLFNLIQDVSSPNHYANIRWEKTSEGWKRVNKTINKTKYSEFMDDEVVFEVYDSDAGPKYRLYNRAETVYRSGTREFDYDKRIIHFCKNGKNLYYLFRITSANLEDEASFVNILQIRLEPDVNFNKKL